MKESTSKEKILKEVRDALIYQNEERFPGLDIESPLYAEAEDSLDVTFAQSLVAVAGKFVYCENEEDFIQNFTHLSKSQEWNPVFCIEDSLKEKFTKAEIKFNTNLDDIDDKKSVGVTSCEALIARLGSVMVSTGHTKSRRIFSFPPIHVIVAYSSQLVYNIDEALEIVKNKYGKRLPSLVTNITGPSRTADIEKTLILGAHGPKELFVFLIDDSSEQ